jgi:hypothetical protein
MKAAKENRLDEACVLGAAAAVKRGSGPSESILGLYRSAGGSNVLATIRDAGAQKNAVTQVRLSSDGKIVMAVESPDRNRSEKEGGSPAVRAHTWETNTGKLLWEKRFSAGTRIEYLPDGKHYLLFVSDEDADQMEVIEIPSGDRVRTIDHQRLSLDRFSSGVWWEKYHFFRNDKFFCLENREEHVWNLNTGVQLPLYLQRGAVAVSDDANRVAVEIASESSWERVVWVLSLSGQKPPEMHTLKAVPDDFHHRNVAWSELGGNHLMQAYPSKWPDGTPNPPLVDILLWDLTTGKCFGFRCARNGGLSPDGSLAFFTQSDSRLSDGRAEILKLPSMESLLRVNGRHVDFPPQGPKVFVSEPSRKRTTVYDTSSGNAVLQLTGAVRPSVCPVAASGSTFIVLTEAPNCVARVQRIDPSAEEAAERLDPDQVWQRWQTKFGFTLDEGDQVVPRGPELPRTVAGWGSERKRLGIAGTQ